MLTYAQEHRIASLVIECVPDQQGTKAIALHNGFAYAGNEDSCDVYRKELKDQF